VKVGIKTPAGIGDDIAKMVKKNLRPQKIIRLKPTAGYYQYSAAILITSNKYYFFDLQ
jgi:hypothetical protein